MKNALENTVNRADHVAERTGELEDTNMKIIYVEEES